MNHRKLILYSLLIVLGIILLYNYLLAPSLVQYNYGMGMGMGMHRNMYNTTNYFIDFRFILLITIAISVLLLMEVFKPQIRSNVCKSCGNNIDNDNWKICPMCGAPVNNRKE